MIVFQLACRAGHGFEAWFRDSAAYDAQIAAADITCPLCGDKHIGKAPMAPHVAKASAGTGALEAKSRELAKGLLQAAKTLRRQVEETCDNVADDFPEEARRIHYGEAQERGIYGKASDKEAAALKDEGIAVQRLPWTPRQDD